jgi:glycosyltransferase involved in cell wall biosynthesis
MPDGALASAVPLPSVSAVIPTRDGKDRLRRVLPPLLASPVEEVVVVVDGSRDGSLELLHDLAADDSRLKPVFGEQRGPSAARQLGLEHATGEVVLLLDDDILVSPELVEGHARRHGESTGLVVLGYTPTVTPTRRRPGDVAVFLYARDYERSFTALAHDPSLVLRTLWGANVSLRRSDCRRVGLQSPAFPERYHEDRDFGLRCLKAGLTGVYDPKLKADHLYTRSVDGFMADARAQGAGVHLVHRLHPDVVGPLSRDVFEDGLPTAARVIVRACRRGFARAVSVTVLRTLLALAGQTRAYRLETILAQLLRRIELQHGAIQVGHVASSTVK